MTRGAHAIVMGVFVLGVISTPAAQDQAPPVFRARVDAVTVDVSVRRGNQPMSGLDASDFSLLDNGVPQAVAAIGMGQVPVDVTLLYGVGFMSTVHVSQFRTDVGRMAQLLDPVDRLRVLEYGTRVREVVALQPSRGSLVIAQLDQLGTSTASPAGGWTTLADALVAAVILPTSLERRQLVVAFYDGYDSISITSPARLQAVAERTEAVLHVQLFPRKNAARNSLGSFPIYLDGFVDALHARDQIIRVAEATGGAVHEAGLLGRGSMVDFFRGVLADYRRSYLLQYTPSDTRKGWHDIAVKVTRSGKFDVHARKGYFVD